MAWTRGDDPDGRSAGKGSEGRSGDRDRDLDPGRDGGENALGWLASMLAHELNQPLGAIANDAEGCLIALDAPEPDLDAIREALRRLRGSALRAGRIIGQVRDLVGGRSGPLEAVDWGRVVADALGVLGAEVRGRGVAVEIDLAPDLPCVRGDPGQLQQVVVNLVQNALHAFDRMEVPKPTLVISTRWCERSRVELAVSDNGPGIDPESLGRVFDASFSTRADGMGMGLAICRTIAAAHRGSLAVESDPGLRTTFRLQLPADDPDHERTDGLHRG